MNIVTVVLDGIKKEFKNGIWPGANPGLVSLLGPGIWWETRTRARDRPLLTLGVVFVLSIARAVGYLRGK